MADVRAFRGIRYNLEAVGDLSLVVAPPYDVIGEEARDHYYNKHPYNVIRLILNKPKKSDTDRDQPYERAARFLERWLAQRVLIRDPLPCLYLYRQRYFISGEYRECTGVVGRVRLEEFADGGILPHEDIMPRPFEDRLKLLEHTRTNLSMVHVLYSDPEEKLRAPILREMERFPIAQFQTEDGIAHDLWGVHEGDFIRRITSFLRDKTLYIADGHHRYHTALEFSKKAKSEGGPLDEEDPRNFLMMMIVEMENPGLSLLPVHRVLMGRDAFDSDGFLKRLGKWFTVAEVDVPDGSASGKVFFLLAELERAGRDAKVFGVYMKDPDRFMLASLKPGIDVEQAIEGDISRANKNLDVTVLHRLVIEEALGVPPDRASVEANLVFTRDPVEAALEVDSGRGSVAFLLNPTRVEQVKEVADCGERMPQKSTYFHPKPCSGVVMNRITDW